MRDDQPAPPSKLRALGTAFAVLAVVAGGVVWSGCGSSDDNNADTVRDQAERQIEEGTKKAEEAVEEGAEKTEKGLEEAKEKIE
ncbi:MAG TPA: hypothetical protein VGV69_00555, partial [Solirubrobacterales bacterium]|nr:hypothetical protein [Solirubrobacterales bacterium]